MTAPTREAIERAVVGALRSAINDHGPIAADKITSAAKRVIGNLANAGVDIPAPAPPPGASTMTQQPFTLRNIQWHYTQPQTLVGHLDAPAPIRDGIIAADVTCNGCGHSWRAGAREFDDTPVGAVRITCPKCTTCKAIPWPDMP